MTSLPFVYVLIYPLSTMISVIATKLSSLSVLDPSLNPQTPDQWRLALQGVKLLYFQRQYKQCAARSAEILKTASEPVSIKPLGPLSGRLKSIG